MRTLMGVFLLGVLATGCSTYGDPATHHYKGVMVTCEHCGSDQVERKKRSVLTGYVGAALVKEYRCAKCGKKVSMKGRVPEKE